MDMIDHSLENSQDKDNDDIEDKDMITAHSLTIVEEEGSLGSTDDQTGSQDLGNSQSLLDSTEDELHYQFQSGEGVTYRVVQVQRSENMDAVPQLVSNPSYSNSASQQSVQALLTNPLNGQFYVIGSPQEVFSTANSRSLAPRANIQIDNVRSVHRPSRDDRRRATHNEVERRRRDKINNWIMNLSKIIPECTQDSSKGSFETQSKGGILAKACDYITELKQSNQRLAEYVKENEHLVAELELIGRQMEELKAENDQLRAQLAQHGIIPATDPLS
ncbi:upstream stimulatory factor 2-like isoform X2 [Lycorma delicatula]|uniref:upstream stimulatory factor 2-like isoform X2 n=1 Tax=Lycorma delicatula TaxID=130591 RepID=UPI003F511B8D